MTAVAVFTPSIVQQKHTSTNRPMTDLLFIRSNCPVEIKLETTTLFPVVRTDDATLSSKTIACIAAVSSARVILLYLQRTH